MGQNSTTASQGVFLSFRKRYEKTGTKVRINTRSIFMKQVNVALVSLIFCGVSVWKHLQKRYKNALLLQIHRTMISPIYLLLGGQQLTILIQWKTWSTRNQSVPRVDNLLLRGAQDVRMSGIAIGILTHTIHVLVVDFFVELFYWNMRQAWLRHCFYDRSKRRKSIAAL